MAILKNTTTQGNMSLTGTYPPLPNNIIKVHYFSNTTGNISVSANTETTILPTNTISVRENSRLYIRAASGQISKGTTNSSPQLRIRVDGTQINNNDQFAWYGGSNISRVWLYSHGISGPLSAGNHDIRLGGVTYNAGFTFNHQGTGRGSTMIVMEIAQ